MEAMLATFDDPEDEAEEATTEPLPRPIKALLLRFCYLCSGPRRPGDLEEYLEQWAVVAGVLIIVDLLDLEVSPPIDLLDSAVQREIRAKAKAG
eukprot:1608728-Alexandrium_andersonii.AAC.1